MFDGDLRRVPREGRDLSTWLTIVTYFSEESERTSIAADVVYLANPQKQVTIRLKAMVRGTNIGSPK